VRCAVKEVGAVVPQHCRGVVLCSRAEEEVKVSPASSRLGGNGRGSPLANDERNTSEVTTYVGNVRLKACLVGI
jgi:hypothetical protein